MHKIKQLFKKIRRRILWKQLVYVIVDPADTSVTFSKDLFEHITEYSEDTSKATAFMFHTSDNHYGFCINELLEDNTQICDIQYNEKHKCIGFETLCPTVARILYDYGLPSMLKVKMTVTYHRAVNGLRYYQLEIPKKDDTGSKV